MAKTPRPRSNYREPNDDELPIDPKTRWDRGVQLTRARAELSLLIDSVGAHAAVVLLNAALREALNEYGRQHGDGPPPAIGV